MVDMSLFWAKTNAETQHAQAAAQMAANDKFRATTDAQRAVNEGPVQAAQAGSIRQNTALAPDIAGGTLQEQSAHAAFLRANAANVRMLYTPPSGVERAAASFRFHPDLPAGDIDSAIGTPAPSSAPLVDQNPFGGAPAPAHEYAKGTPMVPGHGSGMVDSVPAMLAQPNITAMS